MATNFKGNKSMKITQAQRKLKAILTGIGVITTLMFGLSAHAVTSALPGGVRIPASANLRLPIPVGVTASILNAYGAGYHVGLNSPNSMNQYYALDFYIDGVANKWPALAVAPGIVKLAGWAPGGWTTCGQWVVIEHDFGDGHKYLSNYCHLSSVAVSVGQSVAAGEKLGMIGCSSDLGNSCDPRRWGPHLHFSMQRDANISIGPYGGNAAVAEPLGGYQNFYTGMSGITPKASGITPKAPSFYVAPPGSITGLNNLCVDVAHSGTSNGTPIQLWDCNNSNAQKWGIDLTYGGQINSYLGNVVNGECMSIGGVPSHGNHIVTSGNCYQADRWLYQNMELVTAGGKCIDVPGQNFRDGQAVQLYDCNGSDAQKWTYDPSTQVLRAAKNNMCLDARAYGTSNGTVVQIWTCTGASNQQWVQGGGGFTPAYDVAVKCLDVDANGKNANGTKIQLWNCLYNNNQRIALRGQIKNATTGQCLDVPHSHAVAGQQLQAYACNGTGAQRWTMW